jgi:hypothetical protein
VIKETAKEAIIRKALNRGTQTLAQVAKENNVALGTLGHWLSKSKSSTKRSNKAVAGLIESGERYKHLKATFGQTDVMVGAYCRQHGLYPHQLAQWETEFMTNSHPLSRQQPGVEIKALQTEVKELKKTIMLKDKVLAETMALLILKKKAAEIWGDSEDD